MDRTDFIITVYLLVCEQYRALQALTRIRHGGFAPALSDEEVMTIEICGEFFKLHNDQDIFDHFQEHYQDWFPALRERTQFVRQAANLWHTKSLIQQRFTIVSGQAEDPVQIIDTLPVAVCVYTRSRRDRCFKPAADYGYCAAKEMHYYGFKLGLRISHAGMITHFPLLSARPHDIQALDELVRGFVGSVPADKGFIDQVRQTVLAERNGVYVITPPRKNMSATHSRQLMKTCRRIRKRVETVGSHLTERFAIAQIRVRDMWHFQHRLIRKVLAHTVGVFLNLQRFHAPLDLDSLIAG
ncbi:MAG: IS982 family transposase [Chloroflexota bacterium]|nr:MAG: IS982 family transposase [Chloroflexota bacterium]